MTTREEILKYIKELDGAYFDKPFEGDFDTTILRKRGGKWFGAMIKAPESYFLRYGASVPRDRDVLCLKCPPDLQPFLCENFKGDVMPAYHFNKIHWISVVLSSGVPTEEIKKLLRLSYDITKQTKEKRH